MQHVLHVQRTLTMSSKFDWRTEDEVNWDDLESDLPAGQPPHKRGRWFRLSLILVAVVALGAAAWLTLNKRVEENTEAMRADIISTHNLLQIAQAEQDEELFFSLLSGRDSTWTAAQHELFQMQLLFDRSPFGLRAGESAPLTLGDEEGAFTVDFSPDLLAAEVTAMRPFEIAIGNGLVDTVMLQETAVYRLGQERWLLAPADRDFWGSESQLQGNQVTINAPQRDAALAGRLLNDLERKLSEICAALEGIDCAQDLHLEIEFSTDPNSLVEAAHPIVAEQTERGLLVRLPSPTLIGVPQDDGAYQALFRGYAAQMATAVIAHQVGYDCCKQLPFFQALVDFELSQLALKPWPVDDAVYGRLVAERVRLHDLAPLWHRADPQDLYGPDGWRVYAVVDYLLKTAPTGSVATLQRELVRRGSFMGWLNGIFASETDQTNSALMSHLMRGLWLRGYEQNLDVTGLDAKLPGTQDLLLTCIDTNPLYEDDQVTTLYRYDSNEDAWHDLFSTPSFLWITPLPGDQALLQQEFGFNDEYWATNIREENQVLSLTADAEDFTISFGQTDPSVSGVSAFVFDRDSRDALITWFDLSNCQEGTECASRELPGVPVWSPDGSQALFSGDRDAQLGLLQHDQRTTLFDRQAGHVAAPLYLADRDTFLAGAPVSAARDLTPVGSGYAPFWFDNETIGYVTNAAEPFSQRNVRVVIKPAGQGEAQTLFTLRDLVQTLENGIDAIRLYWIQYVVVNPQDPSQLFAVVFSSWNQSVYVMSYNRGSGEIRHLMTSSYLSGHSMGLSANGRYLVLTGMDEGDPNAGEENSLLQVYDLQRQELVPFLSVSTNYPPFSTYDWSLDGDWLAFLLDDNLIGFYSPEKKQLQIVETPAGQCGSPAWLNQ